MNWLILRGLVREQRHWGSFAQSFEDGLRLADSSAKVYCLDFPGFGTESDRKSPTTISDIVDDVRSRWKKIAAPGPSSLMAVSLGGMVAMNWTSRFPEDFQKLVLINSSVSGLSPIYRRMQPKNYLKVLSLFGQRDLVKREEVILRMTTRLQGQALRDRARVHAEFAKNIRNSDAFSQILAATRFRPPAKIEIPVLVLASKGDTLVHPSCSEAIAEHFRAEIRYHDFANHDLALDDPTWIQDQLNEWAPRLAQTSRG